MKEMKDVLRQLRGERDEKQSTVAAALLLSRGTYSSYENGITPPTEICIRLSMYFDVSLEYLLGLSNERRPMGGTLDHAFAALGRLADQNALTSADVASVIAAAIAYYRKGAPCGNIPMDALRGFLSGLHAALNAAANGNSPALIEGANAAAVAALEITKMPAAFYTKRGE